MQTLEQKLALVTSEPGVYLMKDDAGDILYVGKARNLKKRLSSYFRNTARLDVKTGVLVKKIAAFDTIVTASEKEALILEANLIKRHRPRYNVILKDDKRYPALRLETSHPYPKLTIVRKIKDDDNLYFGPFASARAVRDTLKTINKTFKLRRCRNSEFNNRTRPCLHFQMENCLGPCCNEVDPQTYDDMVREAVLFLKGRTRDLVAKARKDMLRAAKARDFEKAARLRDKMFAIEKTVEKQVAVTTDLKDRDALGLAREGDATAVTLLFVRAGCLQGSRSFYFSTPLAGDNEIIAAFIRQYYENQKFVPREILTPFPLEDRALLIEWLADLKNRRVKILSPQRGEKTHLIKMAEHNARIYLADRLSDAAAEKDLLVRLQKRLAMDRLPKRIECFDNSNTGGAETVSGMVVFENGNAHKSGYRRYVIQTVGGPDDYASMAEVLQRRYSRGALSEPLPDLLMVDGGRGQLGIAVSIISELGLGGRFELIGIAKKNERKGELQDKIYKPGRRNPINFGREKDLLLFLQRIRDEAHRFAITFHRKRRARASIHSVLDTIPGVGRQRKHALLKHFGSLKKIRAATLEELSALPGMNHKAAEAVKATLSPE